jgi:hypothetical protein
LTGATYFSNFEIRTTPDAAWERRLPTMPPGTLTRWSLSPSYDALERNLERPLPPSEIDAIPWQDVEAELPGFVVINRYRESPHPRVSFANDFSKRLAPQSGMKVVYGRTNIDSDRDQVKKLYIGYSDDVSVFLNGRILFRGRSAQNFRDPGFLGIVNPENDVVYLPLKKGQQRTGAGGQRARRRMGIHLPLGGPGKLSLSSVALAGTLAEEPAEALPSIRSPPRGPMRPRDAARVALQNRSSREWNSCGFTHRRNEYAKSAMALRLCVFIASVRKTSPSTSHARYHSRRFSA